MTEMSAVYSKNSKKYSIYISTSTYQNKQPLYVTLFSDLSPIHQTSTPPCRAYTLHWKKVNILQRTDGHRRVIYQSLSDRIYNSTSTYQDTQPLYITLPSYP